jgi:hypothetical protein
VKAAARRLVAASRMGLPEIRWRTRTRLMSVLEHRRSAFARPRWRRERLLPALNTDAVPVRLVDALRRGRWLDAHAAASEFLCSEPQRFLIAPSVRKNVVADVLMEYPDASQDAAARAGRIVDGSYDLLGYRGLRFSTSSSAVDWHLDPVHQRRMPVDFWTRVRYLDSANGDHKIVWELNRHQHWLALARGYWLTGDVRYRDRFIEELASWLASNPPLRGCNWASMLEVGLRALSWTWALNSFVTPEVADEEPWTIDLLLALDRQLAHIERNLSFYFSPNTHLLGEALALYVTGLALPFLRASRQRADVGREILVSEIARQIAADGSHRERSSHYHRYTLDFYLLALVMSEIAGDEATPRFRDAVDRLALAATALSDDRGCVAHFGDDDGGTALPICVRAADIVGPSLAIAGILMNRGCASAPEDAYWLLSHPMFEARLRAPGEKRTVPESTVLPEMGYFVSRSPGGVHVVMHAGPHGYLNGGHAHADALSITASLHGEPLLIDPGTGAYTMDTDLRDRFRSTQSHNTITLDNRSQSIPAGPFHWSKRAATTLVEWRSGEGFDYLDALHDGYRPHEHRRHVMSIHDDLLVVMDLVKVVTASGEPRRQHSLASHWHIDPRWYVRVDGHRATLSLNRACVEVFAPTAPLEHFVANVTLGLGWHSPVYGRIEPGSTLRALQTADADAWSVTVFSLRADNAIASVEVLQAPGERTGCGLRIARRRSTDYVLVIEPTLPGVPRLTTFDEVSTDARACFCRVARSRITRTSLVGGALVTVDRSRAVATERSLELVS